MLPCVPACAPCCVLTPCGQDLQECIHPDYSTSGVQIRCANDPLNPLYTTFNSSGVLPTSDGLGRVSITPAKTIVHHHLHLQEVSCPAQTVSKARSCVTGGLLTATLSHSVGQGEPARAKPKAGPAQEQQEPRQDSRPLRRAVHARDADPTDDGNDDTMSLFLQARRMAAESV